MSWRSIVARVFRCGDLRLTHGNAFAFEKASYKFIVMVHGTSGAKAQACGQLDVAAEAATHKSICSIHKLYSQNEALR